MCVKLKILHAHKSNSNIFFLRDTSYNFRTGIIHTHTTTLFLIKQTNTHTHTRTHKELHTAPKLFFFCLSIAAGFFYFFSSSSINETKFSIFSNISICGFFHKKSIDFFEEFNFNNNLLLRK